MNSDLETPKPAAAPPLPNMEKLVFVIGNLSRWKMLRELSAGETRTISELAAVGGCSYDSAVKHLILMREAGVVVQGRGSLYQIPAHYLPTPGQPHVDFGYCLLRINAGK
jgi:hypothetical protein